VVTGRSRPSKLVTSPRMADDAHFRRTARQPIELRVSYRRDLKDAPLEKSGRLVDLGLGGAQIRSVRPPPVETPLRITLASPSSWDPLELGATVRWIGPDRETFGVEFERLSRSEASALYELLSVSRFAEPDR